jgi:hypothetical protein
VPSNAGVVTIGGLRAVSLDYISGAPDGQPERASRDAVFPTVAPDELASWATDQAALLFSAVNDPELQACAAATVIVCGGDPGALAFAETSEGWLTLKELGEWAAEDSEIIVLSSYEVPQERARGGVVALAPRVVWIPTRYTLFLDQSAYDYIEWPEQALFVTPSRSSEGLMSGQTSQPGCGWPETPHWEPSCPRWVPYGGSSRAGSSRSLTSSLKQVCRKSVQEKAPLFG